MVMTTRCLECKQSPKRQVAPVSPLAVMATRGASSSANANNANPQKCQFNNADEPKPPPLNGAPTCTYRH